MTAYRTPNSLYAVTPVVTPSGTLETIVAPRGPFAGQSFGILGYWAPSSQISKVKSPTGAVFFVRPDEGQTPTQIPISISYEDLSQYLDSKPQVGYRIVARRLDEHNGFVPIRQRSDVIISTHISEIHA